MKTNTKIDLGFRHLDLPNTDIEKWCDKYNLKVFTAPCMDCQGPLVANLAISGKNRRGLRARACEKCGNNDVPFTFVDLDYKGTRLL